MGYKIKFIFFILFLIVPCQVNPSIIAPSGQDSLVFEKELKNFLIVSKNYIDLPMQQEADTLKFKQAAKNLELFVERFPQSKFADDASFIVIGVSFIDSIMAQEQDSSKQLINSMGDVFNKYPNLYIEEDTVKYCKIFVNKPILSAFLAIPYKYMIDYMKGFWGWEFRDYQLVVSSYTNLKDRIDYSRDQYGFLSQDIYSFLALAYNQLGEKKAAIKIAEEAMSRFPDNRSLRKFMRKLIKDIGV